MNVERIKIRDIGCFNSGKIIDVNFAQLGGARLVAVMGDNGAGKTTFLECLPGALYRSTPSRGPVAGLSSAKDSLIEITIDVGGKMYRAQLQIDAAVKSTRQVAYLFGDDNAPLTDGRVRTYDEAVSRIFPSREVYLSSAFAAQTGEGRFLDLPASQRKALFAQLLGLGRLEAMSVLAGEKARAMEKELLTLDERKRGLEARASDGPSLKQLLHEGRRELDHVSKELAQAQDAKAEAEAALTEWREQKAKLDIAMLSAQSEAQRCDTTHRHLQREQDDVGSQLERQRDIIAGLKRCLAERDVLMCQAAAADELRVAVEDMEHAIAQMQQQKEAYLELRTQWIEEGQEARAEAERLDREHKTGIERAEAAVNECQARLDDAGKAAKRLSGVPCGGEGAYSACPLIRSAVEAVDSVNILGAQLSDLEQEIERARQPDPRIIQAHNRLSALRAQAPDAPDTSRLTSLEARLRETRVKLDTARQAATRLEALGEDAKRLTEAEDHLYPLGLKWSNLADEISAAEGAVIDARNGVRMARERLDDHSLASPQLPDDLHMEQLRGRERGLLNDISATQARLDMAEKAADELAEIKAHVQATSADHHDWQVLQAALGKSGIQALEIDAAGPEVSDLTNELLHACYGTRFSVSLETTALKADGKGTKEIFGLRVIDTERGTEGSAEQLSGGEKVLVSEALGLAIAIHNTQRSGIPMDDLFRDECSGALSSETARRYIEMLRLALDMGGFRRCFFVAHQPELWELADRRLVFARGNIEVI